jgi:prevent-host-death family protein
MIQVPLYEVKNDLSRYLRIAEKEDVIITRHGVPAGILIGITEAEDWWEEALLRHPLFQKRIAQARQSAREGKGITIEQLRAELNIEAPVVTVATENEKEFSFGNGSAQEVTAEH